ncbi:SAF domain-containing protein [Candidatus Chloroploca asiatica]|uniref:AFP-like domain-containing protein n=1 Tax=Candidatus Chloroploca asiatica TaxID=1506545 RepID=A0A2H3LC35_9CHLR|nr:SAF domain-containing protein [Candidatus Chloroploca asiatica]PDV99984.1 hypothetical protein A9Q02_11155 [Candidatus Chloroploca asiatica]
MDVPDQINAVRITEKALGKVNYAVTEKDSASRVFRRSLFVVQDMAPGDVFTAENVRSIRPGHGLHTRYMDNVLGRYATAAIQRGTPLSWELIG